MKFIWLVCFSLLLASCSNSEQAPEDTDLDSNVVQKNLIEEEGNFLIQTPCELIEEEAIQEIIGFKDKQDVRKESKVLTYPACVFTWPNLIVNRTTYTYGEGIIEKLPAEVKLIMIRNSDLNAYSRAIKTYSDPETIEGVGEGATWGNRLSQLTFFSTNHIFHVTVQVSDDLQTNKSVAIAIAKQMDTAIPR